jgi:hypothetical protein
MLFAFSIVFFKDSSMLKSGIESWLSLAVFLSHPYPHLVL